MSVRLQQHRMRILSKSALLLNCAGALPLPASHLSKRTQMPAFGCDNERTGRRRAWRFGNGLLSLSSFLRLFGVRHRHGPPSPDISYRRLTEMILLLGYSASLLSTFVISAAVLSVILTVTTANKAAGASAPIGLCALMVPPGHALTIQATAVARFCCSCSEHSNAACRQSSLKWYPGLAASPRRWALRSGWPGRAPLAGRQRTQPRTERWRAMAAGLQPASCQPPCNGAAPLLRLFIPRQPLNRVSTPQSWGQ